MEEEKKEWEEEKPIGSISVGNILTSVTQTRCWSYMPPTRTRKDGDVLTTRLCQCPP